MRYRTAARMLPPHRQFLDALHQERLGSVVLRSHIVLERNDAQRDTHLLCRSNGNRAIHRGGHLVIHRQKRGKEIAVLLFHEPAVFGSSVLDVGKVAEKTAFTVHAINRLVEVVEDR